MNLARPAVTYTGGNSSGVGNLRRISFAARSADDHDVSEVSQWRNLLCEYVTTSDLAWSNVYPFAGVFDVLRLTSLDIVRMRAPVGGSEATDETRAVYALVYNHASLPITYRNGGREVCLDRGEATLLRFDQSLKARRQPSPDNEWRCVIIPRERLLGVVAHADDLVCKLLPADNEALGQLKRCLSVLFESGAPMLTERMAGCLDDQVFRLILAVLGEGREVAGRGSSAGSGVRSARRDAVLSEIANSYLDPALSVEIIAARLGLSRRYVFALLRESGTGFSDRVLEFRLQAAFAMLGDAERAALRISEVAYAAGFNEVSHFNRCFRRRFGMTPTDARATPRGAATGSGLSHQAP